MKRGVAGARETSVKRGVRWTYRLSLVAVAALMVAGWMRDAAAQDQTTTMRGPSTPVVNPNGDGRTNNQGGGGTQSSVTNTVSNPTGGASGSTGAGNGVSSF